MPHLRSRDKFIRTQPRVPAAHSCNSPTIFSYSVFGVTGYFLVGWCVGRLSVAGHRQILIFAQSPTVSADNLPIAVATLLLARCLIACSTSSSGFDRLVSVTTSSAYVAVSCVGHVSSPCVRVCVVASSVAGNHPARRSCERFGLPAACFDPLPLAQLIGVDVVRLAEFLVATVGVHVASFQPSIADASLAVANSAMCRWVFAASHHRCLISDRADR